MLRPIVSKVLQSADPLVVPATDIHTLLIIEESCFFDVCRLNAITGNQGVLIPKSNLRNLMLRPDVVQAVKDGKFHIYAVNNTDEGIEVLTGIPAGERDPDGHYPEGSINSRVEKKLRRFSEQLRQVAGTANPTEAASEKSD